ncbi:MAG: radical SAM protein [Myxococcales bacterium]|nr:radical SAM protein [Myxococcales bacterium]MCB9531648.1 radical SAM protein [Myxococcales bacterium]MCB9534217.1 radical SAM protein [Myxococcales bacterium]
MRVAVVEPPVPRGSLTNRDLMGAMGIDSDLGVGVGSRYIAVLKNEGTRMPVISLAYAAAILEAAGHDVEVFELVREDTDDATLVDRIAATRPDWLVCATSFAYLGAELRFCGNVRDACGARRLLVGGASAEFASDIVARGLAECVATGDPEVALASLATGELAPGLSGAVMADDSGAPVRAAAGVVADLDALPLPAWGHFARDRYRYFPLLRQRPFLTTLSSRGCPYLCRFCPYPVTQGAAFRARSPKSVVEELTTLRERFGTRAVLFRDPIFSFDVPRAKAICRGLIEAGAPVTFGVETRLDRLDEELVDLLAAAGCRALEFGGDPHDPEVLRASKRKPIGLDRAAALISQMERAGIAGAGLYVVGLPEQRVDDVARTLDWLLATELSYINVEVATPFPGTPLYDLAVQKGWSRQITLDDLLAGDPKLAFNGVVGIDEMRALQDDALRRFYMRPARVAREIRSGDVRANLRFMAHCARQLIRYEVARA